MLEPVNASPVIIEDDALIGGNTGVYEGTVVRKRAVLAAGTVLTRGTPVYDLVKGEIYKATAETPLIIPEGAVVVPGSRAVTKGKGGGVGFKVSQLLSSSNTVTKKLSFPWSSKISCVIGSRSELRVQ